MSEAEEPVDPDTEDEGVPAEEPEPQPSGQSKYTGGPIPRRASKQSESEEN